jgi:serine/threonine protein kinase
MRSRVLNEGKGQAGTGAVAAQSGPRVKSLAEMAELLSDRFDSLKMIGASSNACFYVARDLRDTSTDGTVWLKVFSEHMTDEAGNLELFKLETISAAKLKHRNILKTGEPEEINGIHLCVIEHRAGTETLKELLDREGWLDLKRAVEIIQQVVEALDYSHRLGILHLRIQPEVILLDREGTALLADFGLETSSCLAWAHAERSRYCSPYYVSPEQVSGGPVDARSDLYALGIMLYKMLTDRVPFDAEENSAIRQKHVSQSPTPPHLLCGDIPIWMSGLIARLLDKSPARRYDSADAFRSVLDSFASARLGIVRKAYDPPPAADDDHADDDHADDDHADDDHAGDNHNENCSPLAADLTMEAREREPCEHEPCVREFWEPPSISIIPPPIEQSLAEPLELNEPPELNPKLNNNNEHAIEPLRRSVEEPAPDNRIIIERSAERLRVNRGRRMRWLRWVAIVALATAVASGLIALGRSAPEKSEPQNQVRIETPLLEEGGESAAPSQDETANTPQVVSTTTPQQPAASQKRVRSARAARAGRAGGLRRSTRRVARQSQRKYVSASTARRSRKVKRKATLPSRQRRNF